MDLPELPLIGPYGLPNLPDERVIPIGYHEDPIQKYWDNPGSQLRDFNFDNYLFTLLSFFNKRAARFLPEYTYKAIMTQMYVALLSHCMLFRTEKVYKLLQGYNAKGPRAWVYIESVWLQECGKYYFRAEQQPLCYCCCCGLLQYYRNLCPLLRKLKSNTPDLEVFRSAIYSLTPPLFVPLHRHFCRTCSIMINKGMIPVKSRINGLVSNKVPQFMKNLNEVEKAMVSPYLPSMQLSRSRCVTQPKLLGCVVEVPLNPTSTECLNLPRQLTDTRCFDLSMIRKNCSLDEIMAYLKAKVNYQKVDEALDFLVKQSAYLQLGIIKRQQSSILQDDFVISSSPNEEATTPSSEIMICLSPLSSVEDSELLDVWISDDECDNCSDHEGRDSDEDDMSYTILETMDTAIPPIETDRYHAQRRIVGEPTFSFDGSNGIWPLNSKWSRKYPKELLFPGIYGGQLEYKASTNLTLQKEAHHKLLRFNMQYDDPKFILYMHNQINANALTGKKHAVFRLRRHGARLDDSMTEYLLNKTLQASRSSPAFWQQKKKDIMALLCHIGKPSLFLTFSPNEANWYDNVRVTLAAQDIKKDRVPLYYTDDQIDKLSKAEKNALIAENGSSCVRKLLDKWMAFQKHILPTFGNITDFYYRVEFQMRGSPHFHMLLWIEGCPSYEDGNKDSERMCVEYIDRHITTQRYSLSDDDWKLTSSQIHRHSPTCQRNGKCRFNFPQPPMEETRILKPIPSIHHTTESLAFLRNLYSKHVYLLKNLSSDSSCTMADWLEALETDWNTYLLMLQTFFLKKTTVLYRRKPADKMVNKYNHVCLKAWRGNCDVSFVFDAYSVGIYCCNYITKSYTKLNKTLQKFKERLVNGNTPVSKLISTLLGHFLKLSQISCQEAVFTVLMEPLSVMSRKVLSVDTNQNKIQIMASSANADSTDANNLKDDKPECIIDLNSDDEADFVPTTDQSQYMNGVREHYLNRSDQLSSVCFAELLTSFDYQTTIPHIRKDNCIFPQKKGPGCWKRRRNLNNRKRILRLQSLHPLKQEKEYLHQQILLYSAHIDCMRNLSLVELRERYTSNLREITENTAAIQKLPDEEITEIISVIEGRRINTIQEYVRYTLDSAVDYQPLLTEQSDIYADDKPLEDFPVSINPATPMETFSVQLPATPRNEILHLLDPLTQDQRDVIYHVINSLDNDERYIPLFIEGAAGTGKSYLIRVLHRVLNFYESHAFTKAAASLDCVLLTAFTGVAACTIGGSTLHSTFNIPIDKDLYDVNPVPFSFKYQDAETRLSTAKFLIIDEVSFVSAEVLNYINRQAQACRGTTSLFGGLYVIAVGDFYQLPPVRSTPLWNAETHEWKYFKKITLTTNRRQKHDSLYAEVLDECRIGNVNQLTTSWLRTRVVTTSEYNRLLCDSSIRHLHFSNETMLETNEAIRTLDRERNSRSCISVPAEDWSTDQVLSGEQLAAMLKGTKYSATGKLPSKLTLQRKFPYMITSNIDLDDGLANGTQCTLEYVEVGKVTRRKKPRDIRLWMSSSKLRIGMNARNETHISIPCVLAHPSWFPLVKIKANFTLQQFNITRWQFPLIPAAAMTIHKSQSLTMDAIVVDCKRNKGSKINFDLFYTAATRTTRGDYLHLLNGLPSLKQTSKQQAVQQFLKDMDVLIYPTLPIATNRISIAFHNVQGIQNKLSHYESDFFYEKIGLLCLAEVATIPAVKSESMWELCGLLEGQQLLGSGMLLMKNKTYTFPSYINSINSSIIHTTYISSISIILNSHTIFFLYIKPNTPASHIIETFTPLLSTSGNLTLMGDFNKSTNKLLQTFFKRYNLHLVNPGSVTHVQGGNLDQAWTNSTECVYVKRPAFFSDHFVISASLIFEQ